MLMLLGEYCYAYTIWLVLACLCYLVSLLCNKLYGETWYVLFIIVSFGKQNANIW